MKWLGNGNATPKTLDKQNISDNNIQPLKDKGLIVLIENNAENVISLAESTWLKCRRDGEVIIYHSLLIDLDLNATQQQNPNWTFDIISQPTQP